MTPAWLLPAAVACVASAVATGLVDVVARRRGLLDEPDPTRRTHTRPTPRLGGVGVVVGLLAGLYAAGVGGGLPVLGALLCGAIGFADDARRARGGLRARVKFAALLGLGTAALVGGLRFDPRAFGAWPGLPDATVWFTPLWLLAVVSVVNFMDGIDGIAAATGVVLLGVGAAAHPSDPLLFAAAGGALLGFLPWNARSRIFLGDGGSYLLGALVALGACHTVSLTGRSEAPPPAPWPLLGAAMVPMIVDVGAALLHKIRHGIPLSQPHHDHLYQRLVKAGHPALLVAARYGGLSLAAVLVAGPLADRLGPAPASALGLGVLVVHLVLGARTTRGIRRLRREGAS